MQAYMQQRLRKLQKNKMASFLLDLSKKMWFILLRTPIFTQQTLSLGTYCVPGTKSHIRNTGKNRDSQQFLTSRGLRLLPDIPSSSLFKHSDWLTIWEHPAPLTCPHPSPQAPQSQPGPHPLSLLTPAPCTAQQSNALLNLKKQSQEPTERGT